MKRTGAVLLASFVVATVVLCSVGKILPYRDYHAAETVLDGTRVKVRLLQTPSRDPTGSLYEPFMSVTSPALRDPLCLVRVADVILRPGTAHQDELPVEMRESAREGDKAYFDGVPSALVYANQEMTLSLHWSDACPAPREQQLRLSIPTNYREERDSLWRAIVHIT